jgi:hypothetical protein
MSALCHERTHAPQQNWIIGSGHIAGANEMAQIIPLEPRRHLIGVRFSFLFAGLLAPACPA